MEGSKPFTKSGEPRTSKQTEFFLLSSATIEKLNGMGALVLSEMTALCRSIVAFVAGIRALTEMNALVCSKRAAMCASIVAFVAGVRTLAGMRALV